MFNHKLSLYCTNWAAKHITWWWKTLVIDWLPLTTFIKIDFRANLVEIECLYEFLTYFILLGNEVFEFKIILDHFVSTSFYVMKKWTQLLTLITLIFLQEIQTVFWCTKTTFQCRVWVWDSQTIQATHSNSHIDWAFIPYIDCTLSLLWVIVFRKVIDQNSLDITILSKELRWPYDIFISIFSWKANDVE